MILPEIIPEISKEKLLSMSGKSFPEVSFEIASLFIGEDEIPRNDLWIIIKEAFEKFECKDILPFKELSDNICKKKNL